MALENFSSDRYENQDLSPEGFAIEQQSVIDSTKAELRNMKHGPEIAALDQRQNNLDSLYGSHYDVDGNFVEEA